MGFDKNNLKTIGCELIVISLVEIYNVYLVYDNNIMCGACNDKYNIWKVLLHNHSVTTADCRMKGLREAANPDLARVHS